VSSFSRWYGLAVAKLSRVTSTGRYIPELDGLRFIAIGIVFLQHVQEVVMVRMGSDLVGTGLDIGLFSRLIRDSRFGVELFFLISGFILGLPFADQYLAGGRRVRLHSYFLRRVTRLEPPYIISLLLCTAALIAFNGRRIADLWPHLVASSLYVHNIVYNEFSVINPVAWSLEIEVQFYCLAPLLAQVFRIERREWRRVAIVAIGLGALAVRYVIGRYYQLPPTILFYMQYFMMGFLVADVFLVNWQQQPKTSKRWDLIALPGWLLLPLIFYRAFSVSSLVTAGVLFLLVWASFKSSLCRRFLGSSLIRTIGGMCYTIYLLHYIAMWSTARLINPRHDAPVLAETVKYSLFFFILLLPLVVAYFLFIEKPCMRKHWPTELLAKLRAKPRLVANRDNSASNAVAAPEPTIQLTEANEISANESRKS
jgi:peptidoglycan/LPS O-acetylase OafA/YrhL